jgi:hypothetical protein
MTKPLKSPTMTMSDVRPLCKINAFTGVIRLECNSPNMAGRTRSLPATYMRRAVVNVVAFKAPKQDAATATAKMMPPAEPRSVDPKSYSYLP